MTERREERTGRMSRNRATAWIMPLAAALLLAGCSQVPDAANPVEWYRSTVDYFSGDEEQTAESGNGEAGGSAEVPGAGDEFPSLSSVPERPTVDGNGTVAEGLVADPNRSEYAPSVSRQTEDPEDRSTAELQPAPPPQPTVPVEPAPAPEPAEAQPGTTAEVTQSAQSATPPPEPDMDGNGSQDETAAVPRSEPLVVEPGRLPNGETYEEYRARLMKGLETQPGYSALPSSMPATPSAGGDLGTVVISSAGVESEGYGVASAGGAVSVGPAGFQTMRGEGGTSALAAGATRVASIHFANGSANLDSRDRAVLRKVAALQAQSGGTVRIIGHASSRTRSMDPVRHKMVNYQMSVARAESVARALAALGTPRDRIVVGAVGDTEPVYYEVMPSGEAGNRRTEIYIDS